MYLGMFEKGKDFEEQIESGESNFLSLLGLVYMYLGLFNKGKDFEEKIE
jgi:hypothetical protein